MEPIEYLRILRRRWRIVAAAVVLGGLVVFLTTPDSAATEPTRSFSATHTLYRDPSAVSNAVTMDTMALLATTGEIPRRVAKELGSSEEPAILATRVTVAPDQNLGVLQFTATNTEGEEAARLANAFAEETVAYFDERDAIRQAEATERLDAQLEEQEEEIRSLEDQITRLESNGDGEADVLRSRRDALIRTYGYTVEQAQTLANQYTGSSGLVTLQTAVPIPVAEGGFQAPSNRLSRTALAALIAGLLGAVLGFMMDRLDVRIRTRRGAQAAFGLPVVAEIPKVRIGRHTIVTVARPASYAAEAFRMLRLSLQLATRYRSAAGNGQGDPVPVPRPERTHDGAQVVMVTSASPAEGKTTTAANVAASFAEIGKRVLVLDCDFRHAEQHRYFGAERAPGVSDYLARAEHRPDLHSLVQATTVPGVSIIPNGTFMDNPGELIAPDQDLIRGAAQLADVVVVDAGPVLSVNDPLALMPHVDGVVLVARSGKTTAEMAHRVAEVLTRADAPVVGVALVGVARSASSQPYYAQSRSMPMDPTWWRRDKRTKQSARPTDPEDSRSAR